MIVLVQRAAQAQVDVEGRTVGRIGRGLLAFVCAERGDDDESVRALARRLVRLRIFEDDAGKMNLSVRDIGGEVLSVSQFTLAADTRRGTRPSFSGAAAPELGLHCWELFTQTVREEGIPVQTGIFGAHMMVSLVNDGPATFRLRTPPKDAA